MTRTPWVFLCGALALVTAAGASTFLQVSQEELVTRAEAVVQGRVQVASATTTSNNESISYSGAAGWYLWGVYSYSGSGTYHFYYDHP